jgi:hypothetical protein
MVLPYENEIRSILMSVGDVPKHDCKSKLSGKLKHWDSWAPNKTYCCGSDKCSLKDHVLKIWSSVHGGIGKWWDLLRDIGVSLLSGWWNLGLFLCLSFVIWL